LKIIEEVLDVALKIYIDKNEQENIDIVNKLKESIKSNHS